MFTYNWFGDNGSHWINWLDKFKNQSNLHFLEIGCFEGRATVWLLEHILTHPLSKITVIDTFEGSIEHKARNLDTSGMLHNFLENTKKFITQVIIKKGYSQVILREFETNPELKDKVEFDFIYIDGSHQAADVLEDTVLAWRLLKQGGIMIWDDYQWHASGDPIEAPKLAIDAFLANFKGQYELISKNHQVCVEKI